ncbi:T9SS type A sorting domain-containing protein [Marinilabiliaceae bacterium ANBcel2]|nr:T9SS type A sorting domain-containing protein [Marinilabiliaceae bacterium ANBcel2]
MRFFILYIFLNLTFGVVGQTYIKGYEFWFNNDKEVAVMNQVAGQPQHFNLQREISAQHLSDGLHNFNIRFLDSEGRWSSVVSQFFYKIPESPGSNSIVEYQYWFNGDYQDAVTKSASGNEYFNISESIDAGLLPDGLHTFNFRAKDSRGVWSSVVSQFFYKVPESPGSNSIVEYQYWFNGDYQDAVTKSASGNEYFNISESIDAGLLPDGLHTFNFRAKDSRGVWSSVVSQFFYKIPQQEADGGNLVDAYEYWFDDYSKEVYRVELDEPVNPYHLIYDVETPYLEAGEHSLNIRFRDLRNRWSVVVTEQFNVEECLPRYVGDIKGDIEICQGSVKNYSVDVALNVTDVEWSISPVEAGLITSDYNSVEIEWNDNYSGDVTISAVAANPCGNIDPAVLDVEIAPLPYVETVADVDICYGDHFELDVKSYVGTIEWNVENRVVSPLETKTYVVTASTEYCGTAEDEITVNVTPLPNTNLNVEGDIVTAVAEGATYQWFSCDNDLIAIDGATEQSLKVSDSGSYAVEITKNGCTVVSDCIDMVVSHFSHLSKNGAPYSRVYPNPTSGLLNVEFDSFIDYVTLQVFTITGKHVYLQSFNDVDNISIDLSSYANGIYILQIEKDGYSSYVRVIKK